MYLTYPIILCSMRQLAELGYRLIFYYFRCTVQDPRIGQELGIGPKIGHMFPVDEELVASISVATAVVAVSSLHSLELWHSCLGHAPSSWIQQLAFKGLLNSMSKDNFHCTSCQLEK